MCPIFTSTPVSEKLTHLLHTMPKIELHVHLEGATNAETIWELARRNHVTLPASTLSEWQSMYTFRDFDHFIETYILATECMKTPDDFACMTERFIEQQAKHNVKYCEVFLSASLMLDKFPQDELITALTESVKRGEAKYGIQLRFIPDITREIPESRYRVLDFVMKGREGGIFIGLSLAGKEVGFPPELFSDVFAEARRQGLHVVAHAGETEGPQSIWGALQSLHPERIGHGVRALEDPLLVEELSKIQIPLEVSPYSNYRLKVVSQDQPHPIRALMDQGVYVTVNTDDPPMFSTDLTQEYLLLAAQGFTYDELWQLNLNGLHAAFLGDDEKIQLRKKFDTFREN